jgi:hypothetical protein
VERDKARGARARIWVCYSWNTHSTASALAMTRESFNGKSATNAQLERNGPAWNALILNDL